MHNGYHHSSAPTPPEKPPRAIITAETEIRHLPPHDIKNMGNILGEEWKELMYSIPGSKSGNKRFDMSDVDILVQALRNGNRYTGFELLIDNWGTMEEWGRSSTGRRPRPKVKDLLTLCRQIDNYRAASYVNHDILGNEPIQAPMNTDETIDFTEFPSECSQVSLSMEVLEMEDIMVEDTIDTALENNSDFLDCPIPPEHGLDVPYVKFSYLWHITDGFHRNVKIGQGGFSEVFKGVTSRSKKLLAIKKLNSSSDEAQKLMNFEVDNLPRLKHRNIIDLYGYSNDSPTSPCLIYPFMENGTLSGMLRYDNQHEKHLNSKQRVDISKGVAEGICYIHRLHSEPGKVLIHRDIKTSNILLDENLIPKVADFGLLRLAVSGEDMESTCTRVQKGTPAYMPPEANFQNDCSAKWDVWSFGVVLLEILTSLPVIDRRREEQDIVTHINTYIEDHGDNSWKEFLDPCWDKEKLVEVANSIYDLIKKRCLVQSKKNRASSEEIVQELRKL